MGNNQSQYIDPTHVRIYKNLLNIQNPTTRVQMIQTVLAGPEFVQSAKVSGVYSHLLNYSARVINNQQLPLLPYEEPHKIVNNQSNQSN